MARRNRREPPRSNEQPGSPGLTAGERREEYLGAEYVVRPVTGAAASKTYRCPGCDQEIRPGQPHVVAYPEDDVDDRRHWHTACWTNRTKRAPGIQRGRGAPRY